MGIILTLALKIEGEDMLKVKAGKGVKRSLGRCVPETAYLEISAWKADGRDLVSRQLEATVAGGVTRASKAGMPPAEFLRAARARIQAYAIVR